MNEKSRIAALKSWENPKIRRKRIESMKQAFQKPKYKIKRKLIQKHLSEMHRKSMLKHWANPEYKKRLMKIMHSKEHRLKLKLSHLGNIPANKGIKMDKQFREECKERQIKLWKDPKYRKHMCKMRKLQAQKQWKKIKISGGRKYIYDPTNPNANKKGRIRLARYLMEKKLKRYLTKEEVVHHIDENKLNDKLSNLMLFPNQAKHAKIPKKFHTHG